MSYLLSSRLGYIAVGFEKCADIEGLASPERAMDSPVEGELKRSLVEGAVEIDERRSGEGASSNSHSPGLRTMASLWCSFAGGWLDSFTSTMRLG
jgi:hypothetical protein